MGVRIWKNPPLLRSPDAYIAATSTLRFVKDKQRILVVSDAAGRDWRTLSGAGKEVYALDLAPQSHIPRLVVESIESRTL
jgi:hypothetical protein